MRKIFSLAVLAISLVAFPAHGEQTIYVFDLGAATGELCPGGETSPLSLATEMARRRLNGAPGDDSATILGFTSHAEIFGAGTGAEAADSLSRLKSSGEESHLRAGLAAAHELTKGREKGKSRIVVYSAGGEDSLRSLVSILRELSAADVPVELIFFDREALPTAAEAEASPSLLRVGQYGCSEGAAPERASILRRVREIVSQHIGVQPEAIAEDQHLSTFAADRLQVYEIISALGREFHLPVPAEDNVSIATIVNAIAERTNKKEEPGEIGSEMNIDAAPSFTATAVAKKAFFEQKIYYGTNRKRTGRTEPAQFYNGERSAQGKVEYGSCIVTIPARHKEGTVETPFLGLTFLEDANEHVRLVRVTPTTRAEFFQGMKENLNTTPAKEGWENDVVVFIHGFNVPFDEAAKRTAQMAFDFGFKGAPIFFSWPSDGKFYAYLADREDIQWSVLHIEQFLNELAETLLPRRIHLVAHSMGNQGLIGALNMLTLRRGTENRPLFENVILAAPDFDAQLFQEQIAPRVQKIAKRWTVYTSDNDAALNISTTINSARRLGLPVTPVNGIDVIDATGIEVTPWSVPEFHSYYATKQTVIQDIVNTIKGRAPSMRALLPKAEAGIPYWRLAAGR